MKRLLQRFTAGAAFTAVFFTGIVAQVPDWYTTHKSVRYPSEMYIIGVGAASGDKAVETAKKTAQADLVSQIRVQVQAQIKSVSESFRLNDNEQLYSDLRSNVRTAVNDEIAGMEVVETATDQVTGSVYALVVLDREKYCGNLRGDMDSGWKQALDSRTASNGFANQGKLDDALQSLLEARMAIPPLLTKQTLYNAVSNAPYKPAADFGPSTIASDIRQVLSDVRLVKKSGDKQKGRIGERFPEPFVVHVMINREHKEVPVVGTTVIFETPDKMKAGETTTDEQGLASFSTTIRAMKGNGIRARISFRKLDREFEQSITSSVVNFGWTAEASSITFALKIDAKSAKSTLALKNAVSAAITEIGYKIVNTSPHVLQISVETGETNKVDGMAGTMYSVSANVVATLLDKGTDNTRGSVTFTGKGLARSESEAMEKAVGNAKIVQKDLSELLEKAPQK